jgi:hypothetical protein
MAETEANFARGLQMKEESWIIWNMWKNQNEDKELGHLILGTSNRIRSGQQWIRLSPSTESRDSDRKR